MEHHRTVPDASTCIEKGGVAMGCAWGRCELRTRVCHLFSPETEPPYTLNTVLWGRMSGQRGGWRSCMGKHRALPTPGWIEGRSVDIGAGEAQSAQPYSQPFKFLKEKNLQPFTF